jgi:protein TonB
VAKEKKIQGKVFVQFVINKDGNVEDVKLAKGVDPLLDEAAMNIVKSMPQWKPGKQRGQYVKVSFTIPINFQL